MLKSIVILNKWIENVWTDFCYEIRMTVSKYNTPYAIVAF